MKIDLRDQADVTLDSVLDACKAGATEVLVTIAQSHEIYTGLQQHVRWDSPATFDDPHHLVFRPKIPAHPGWRDITIRTVV